MSSTVNFTNIYGALISPQQVDNLDYFEKHYFNDNTLIKKEFFKEGLLSDTLYYVSSNENLNELINTFQNKKVTFYANKINHGQYNQFDSLAYDNNALINKSIIVTDGLEKIICEKKLNVSDNLATEYEKYFYSDNDLVYLFQYYNNGDLRSIVHFDELSGTEEFYHDSQKALEFNWNNLSYFQSGEPIIPT